MSAKYCLLVCFILILFLSCFDNKKNNTNTVIELQQKEENSSLEVVVAVSEVDEMKKFINKNERRILERNLEIDFIAKANFGIPGGSNWIVRLNDRTIIVYAINDDGLQKRYGTVSFNLFEHSAFDIMQNIPGTRIGNSTSSIGDFNGDGIDEIFIYGFYGAGEYIVIYGYDIDKDTFEKVHCRIPFQIISLDNGPAPVEFMTYNGMYGFKVFFYQLEVAGGPGWVPDPNPKNGKWIFYTWDTSKRRYVEIGEVVDE